MAELEFEGRFLDPRGHTLEQYHITSKSWLYTWKENVGQWPFGAENTGVLKLDNNIEEGVLESEKKKVSLIKSPTNLCHPPLQSWKAYL